MTNLIKRYRLVISTLFLRILKFGNGGIEGLARLVIALEKIGQVLSLVNLENSCDKFPIFLLQSVHNLFHRTFLLCALAAGSQFNNTAPKQHPKIYNHNKQGRTHA